MIFIETNFQELKRKIDIVKNKRWIRIPKKGYGEVGLKFEEELNLSNNDFSVPDFNGIEIKVKRITSNYPITMFSCTCDGPELFEMKRIVQKYGANSSSKQKSKVLFITLSCLKYSNWGNFLKMKLEVDRRDNRVYIVIAHSNGKIIERKAYWQLSTLDEIMKRKMHYLCFVTYDTIYSGKARYACFLDDNYLVYRDFDKFVELLESGDIVVNIKCGIYRDGTKAGKLHDHGTSFQIFKSALFELYEHFDFDSKIK